MIVTPKRPEGRGGGQNSAYGRLRRPFFSLRVAPFAVKYEFCRRIARLCLIQGHQTKA